MSNSATSCVGCVFLSCRLSCFIFVMCVGFILSCLVFVVLWLVCVFSLSCRVLYWSCLVCSLSFSLSLCLLKEENLCLSPRKQTVLFCDSVLCPLPLWLCRAVLSRVFAQDKTTPDTKTPHQDQETKTRLDRTPRTALLCESSSPRRNDPILPPTERARAVDLTHHGKRAHTNGVSWTERNEGPLPTQTMAFVQRTTRDRNTVGFRKEATASGVGPGAYNNAPTQLGKVRPSYAPFGSSNQSRCLCVCCVNVTLLTVLT